MVAACEHPSDTNTQTHTRIHLHQTMFTNMDTHTHHGVNSDCESVASVFQCQSSLNQCLPSIQSLVWIYWIWIHQSEAACLLFRTKTTVATSFRRWDGWKTCPDRDFQLWFEWNLYRFPLTPISMSVTFSESKHIICVGRVKIERVRRIYLDMRNRFRESCAL